MPNRRVTALMERWYRNQVNGTEEFRILIATQLRAEHRLLDLGCGSGREEIAFKNSCAYVVGCDYTNQVGQNLFISAGVRGDAYELPFRDGTFDIVTMDFVMEHLEFPHQCAAEISRVLRYGGSLFFRTPNFYHYVALIAYLTPHWAHRLVVHKLAETDEAEPFETYYRVNTRKAVQQIFQQVGLLPVEIKLIEKEPYYLSFAAPTFALGFGYERFVNKYSALEQFRSNILGHFRKTSG